MMKQMKYFQAVVRCKSFTKAAEECFISQSAISQQIRALENELGVKLLIRRNRSFSLTPAGEYFYQKSLVLISDYERICRETVRVAKKDQAKLHVGCIRGYCGGEFELVVADFAEKYPEVSVEIMSGNHEELYDALRGGHADLILNDQRRAFSDEYVNCVLAAKECYVEIAARNPLSDRSCIETEELKNTPCILVASPEQWETEKTFYREILGIRGEFVYAPNLEEARLMVIGGRGSMPVEGGENHTEIGKNLRRILLHRNGKPVCRNYCAFWRTDNSGYYVESFAEILKAQF